MLSTKIIAHIGCSEHTFALADICNPYFINQGNQALMMPLFCAEADFPHFFKSLFSAHNLCGAVIGIPYKSVTPKLLDNLSRRAKVADSCNVVRRSENGSLEGDVFEGEGLVRALKKQGFTPQGKSALVLGCGGVGSAVAAALAEAGVKVLRLHDRNAPSAAALRRRVQRHYLGVKVEIANDAADMDLVVNASRCGEHGSAESPTDISRIAARAWVAETVIKHDTALLRAAAAKGCTVQYGTAMALEQIPLYLDYFGLPAENVKHLNDLITAKTHAVPSENHHAHHKGQKHR